MQKQKIALLFLLGTISFQLLVHFNLLFLVQGNVALYGQLIHQGLRPYVDFYLHYPPAIPYLAAWIGRFSQDLVFPYHAMWVGTIILSTLLVYTTARTLFATKKAVAILATLIFTFWHIFWAKNIFWFHTPIPALALLSTYFVCHTSQPRTKHMIIPVLLWFLAGIALGIASLFKQPAIFYFLALLAILLVPKLTPRGCQLKHACWLSLGYVLPIALIFLLYAQRGELATFIQYVVTEGVATTNTNTYGTITFLTTGPPKNLVQFALYLMLIPYLKLVRPLLSSKEGFPHLLLLAGLAGGSLFLYPHVWVQYAQMALPFLALVTAYVLAQGKALKLFAGIFLITLIPLLTNLIPHVQKDRGSDVSYRPVVAWLQANTRGDERIFVCCTEPEIYWYSRRVPASRYTEYNGPMLATIDLNKEIIEDLEKHQPRIIVEFADNIWEKFNVVYVPHVLDYIHQQYTLKQEILPKVYIYERNKN